MSDDVQARLSELSRKPENKYCADCGARNPRWADIPFGICICHKCSGAHRNIGTQTSFVRSIDLDNWNSDQLKHMELGGNRQWLEYTREHGIDHLSIPEKYNTQLAKKYSRDLDFLVNKKIPRSQSVEPSSPKLKPDQPTVSVQDEICTKTEEIHEEQQQNSKETSVPMEIREARSKPKRLKKRGSKPVLIQVRSLSDSDDFED